MNPIIHVRDMVDHRDAVYVGRRNNRYGLAASPLANPYPISKSLSRAASLTAYRSWLEGLLQGGFKPEALIALRGKTLACWCRHAGEPRTDANACHADVIAELLERYSDDELRAMVRCGTFPAPASSI